MKKNTRVYGECLNIKKEKVKSFWNNRAEKYSEKNPYKSIKCNDNNEEYAKKLAEYENNYILPKLNINKDSTVLDIGCGVGRLAEIIIPNSKYYVGTDFARSLLEIAKSRIKFKGDYDFYVCDFLNLIENSDIVKNRPFSTVILAGVCMYINDDELKECFKNLLKILDKNSILYINSPVGVKERLTLNEFYSESLNSEYNVIYRTIEEYLELFNNMGFKVIEDEDFLTEEKQYSDTKRHYFILGLK